MKPPLAAVACLFVAGLPWNLAVSAQVTTQPIVLAGQSAPDTPDNRYFNQAAGRIFGVPLINNAGVIAFWGRTASSDIIYGTTAYGIWLGVPDDLRLVALTGDPAPGMPEGTGFLLLWDSVFHGIALRLNDVGSVAFSSRLSGPDIQYPSIQYGIWAGSKDSLELVVRDGDELPAVPGLHVKLDEMPVALAFNDVGSVCIRLQLLDGAGQSAGYGSWCGTSPLAPLALLNQPAPGMPPGVYFWYVDAEAVTLNSANSAAFVGGIAGPGITCCGGDDFGIWAGSAEDLVVAALGGTQAVGLPPGIVYTSIDVYERIAINNSGEIAFHSDLKGGPAYDRGVWFGQPGDLSPVARSNTPAPGLPGGQFVQFYAPSITSNGLIAVGALVSTPGAPYPVNAIYGGKPDQLRLIAYVGMPAPGLNAGVTFGGIAPTMLPCNRRGQVAFLAGLQGPGVDSSNTWSLWVGGPNDRLLLVARAGDTIEVATGDERTIRDIEVAPTGGGEDGHGRALNDSGELVYRATISPGFEGLFLARIPRFGDCDVDGGFARSDLLALSACLNGPDVVAPPSCDCFDWNGDSDTDLEDFAAIQRAFPGE